MMLANNEKHVVSWVASYAVFLSFFLCLPAHSFAQKTKRKPMKREETPHEKFARKGGREVKAEVISGKDGELTTRFITDQRDLKLYEQSAHFDFREWTEEARKDPLAHRRQVELNTVTAREFIWEHWQNKKRGYLRFSGNTVDSTGTSHIFIEPDDKGIWQIAWLTVHVHALIGNSVSYSPIIRRVERTKEYNRKTILKFKDADGEETTSF